MRVSSDTDRVDEARRAVASNPFWYHTIEVAPGVVTPGWFDLRGVVDRMPWPDVRGKRCLDVGTADGFLAFELERRGAAEVVAADVADHALWDYPARIRERGIEWWVEVAGEKKGQGFRIARDLLGSHVRPLEVSAYDLSPSEVGEFDVVVCGSLLLHLRDPVHALEAMRSVCSGQLLVTNQVALRLSVFRRSPLAAFEGMTDLGQWWVPNPLGNRRIVEAAGFDVERESRIFAIPFGEGHAPRDGRPTAHARRLARRLLAGGDGVPHHAVLASPALKARG
jgi:tRNA (mo5U34)-methyltransferase